MLEDVEGALWRRAQIEALRIKQHQVPFLKRIVVAIGPNASTEEDSNECGIVRAGLGNDATLLFSTKFRA